MFDSTKRISVKRGRGLVTAAQMPLMGSGGLSTSMGTYSNLNVSAISTFFQRSETLLRGIADEQELAFRTFYRDIYRYDVVAGTAVEMMSVLPFSDFTLQGGTPKQLEVFNRNIDNLGMRTLFPQLSVDYYVSGRSISSMLYDNDKKVFTDLMSHNPDNAEITPNPLYDQEPRIKCRVDPELRQFLDSRDPYFTKLKERMPESVLHALKNSHVVLDPLTTLFLPRALTPRSTGTSLYRRLIPIYLLEKVLYRGTITEAARRQRAIGHIMAGSQYWEPQDADLQNLLAMFQQADLDPNGAMIATRNDVQYQDIRPGGDFWKWTDTAEQLTPFKMRALGINDALLSGEANISTQEASLSLFLEQLRTYRDYATRRTFYDRIFPMISIVNGFKPSKHEESKILTETANGNIDQLDEETEDAIIFHQLGDHNVLIPQVRWHKQLRPEADREHLDVLNTMAERGVPVGLRTWAAAGGLDLDKEVKELENDIQIRKKIQSITGVLGNQGQQQDEGPDDSYQGSEAQAHVAAIVDSMSDTEIAAAVRMQTGQYRVPILARDFGGASEIIGTSRTGKPKAVLNQARANRQYNEQMATVIGRLTNADHFAKVLADAKTKGVP